jgi:acetylornithine deacetylase
MDPVKFTRQLVDIESVTGNEARVAEFLAGELHRLGYAITRMPVEDGRFNVYAVPPEQPVPAIVFSTHMDTVPPFIPSSEDAANIYGRGACDAKGIIAAQVTASGRLRREGPFTALLFTVGEERDSIGAKVANASAPGSRFLINGEPTDNRVAVASKGVLRVDVVARGRMAHSAYPELGESAIAKLIEALHRLQSMRLPVSSEVGPCTLNIGMIEGGRATNVVSDFAQAQLLYRLVGPSDQLRREIVEAVAGLAEAEFVVESPFVRLRAPEGLPTMVAAFATDIPSLPDWGEPLLVGPGSIHVAHTPDEFLSKAEQAQAIELYCALARRLAQSA